VLANQDGDAQNASAWLVLMNGDTPTIIDRVDVRIEQHGNVVSICLLAVVLKAQVTVRTSCEVELHCSTFRGNVTFARLVAMSTDTATHQSSNI